MFIQVQQTLISNFSKNSPRVIFAILGALISSFSLSACKNPLVAKTTSLNSAQQPAGSVSYRPMSLVHSSITGTGPVASDGVSTSVISIVLKDADGIPIEGIVPTFSATNTQMLNIYGACTTTNSSGVSSCTLKSNYAETKTITLRSPAVLAGNSVVFQDAPSGILNSSISATSNITANNVSTSTITLTLKDESNSPFAETPILSVSGTGNTLTCGTTNASTGVTTCTLKSTKSEVKTITIVSPSGLGGLSTTATFVTDSATENSTISVSGTPQANDSDLATVTVTLKDAFSNLVSGVTPTLSATGTGNTLNACSSSNASGVSTCTLKSSIAEAKTISIATPVTATATTAGTANFTPIVTSITPQAGLSTGGTTITLTGQGFKNGNTVKINGVACASSGYTNATTHTCVTPALAGINGIYDVTVTTSDNNVGTLAKSFTYVGAPIVWLKADAITGLNSGDPITSWTDSSGNNNHAAQATSTKRPLWISNTLNGQPVVRLDGTDDGLDFTSALTTIRTVITVFKHATGVQNYSSILGNSVTYYDFHGSTDTGLFALPWSNASITGGSTYLNDVSVTPINILKPKSYSLLSLITTGNVRASNIGINLTYPGWQGDFAELIIYNSALTNTERQAVESYLQSKYSLPSAANSTFTVTGSPLSNNSDLATVSVTTLKDSQGNTLPISSPTVAVGGSNNTVSAVSSNGSGGWTFTVRSSSAEAKRITINNTHFGNAYFVPVSGMSSTLSSMQLWYKADAITGVADGASITSWPDSSGKGRDTFRYNSANLPTYNSSDALANNQPSVTFGATATCLLGTTGNALTSLTTPTIFTVAKATNMAKGTGQQIISYAVLGGSDQNWTTSGMSVSMGASRAYFNSNNSASGRYTGYASAAGENGSYYWGFANNIYYIFTALASGGTGIIYAGGQTTESGEGAWIASVSPNAFALGNMAPNCGNWLGNSVVFEGNIAEVIMYNTRLSDTDRKAVECYLKAKYNGTLFYNSCP